MSTVVVGSPPPELKALLQRRKRAGADRHDEVWKGVLHMSPEPSRAHLYVQQQLAELLGPLARAARLIPGIGGFNLGAENEYRVPDGGLFREPSTAVWNPTAALVIEIISPGDESWEKLPFYATHGVEEVLIVDPAERTVAWLALAEDEYRPVVRSGLIELGPVVLTELIDWPS
ncbi:MAG: Uma2 family endonuclease [Solirubrobacteraceae bacterium]